MFPSNYVELVKEDPPQYQESGLTAVALYDYQAYAEDELSFDPGNVITNIEQAIIQTFIEGLL